MEPSAVVGPYVLTTLLGKGAFGAVWKARDGKLGRDVAVKLLDVPDDAERRRFLREARTAASLDHPNVAAVYDAGLDGDRAWIAMQLIDGASPKGPMSPREAALIVRDAARGVAHAHERGIVHRDIKPGNLLVAGGRVYVLDFGLAKSLSAPTLTASGMLIGTPWFMSPEQARGNPADARSDVWALGATLHMLVAGRPPFDAPAMPDLLRRITDDDPAPLPGVERGLAAVVAACLEKKPERRYANAAALADDLDRWIDGRPVVARPPGAAARFLRRRGALLAAACALLALLAASAGAMAILIRRSEAATARRDALQRLTGVIAEARPHFYIADADIPAQIARVERALADLERLDPDAPGWAELAWGRWFVGDREGADRAAMRALSLSPREPRAHALLARVCIERSLIRSHEDDVQRVLAQREHWSRRALAHTLEARDAATHPMDAHIAGAYLLAAKGDTPALLAACGEGLSLFGDAPGTEEYWILRAIVADGDERVAACTRAIERRPHYAWAYYLRADGRVGGPEAEADLTAAVRINPRLVDAWVDRAFHRLQRGALDEAASDFAAALRLDPSNAWALEGRGAVKHKRGDLDGAIADYRAAVARDRGNRVAWFNLGNALRAKEDWAAAVAAYGESLRVRETPDARANRGLARAASGDRRGAAEDFRRALEQAPAGWAWRAMVEEQLREVQR